MLRGRKIIKSLSGDRTDLWDLFRKILKIVIPSLTLFISVIVEINLCV